MKQFYTLVCLVLFFLNSAQEITITEPPIEYAGEEYVPTTDQTEKERIIFFRSNITVEENSDVLVTETIKVYARGQAIKRGLFRALPMVRNTTTGEEKITYDIISIKKDGYKESYHKEIVNGVFNIYIGDKDIILNPGYYTYEIVYKTQDQIGHFNGFDEFYWNVNGTDWEFPIAAIEATITLPNGATILQNSCYTGTSGSTDKNCTGEKLSETSMRFKADNLAEKENLTVAVGFKAGVLKEPSWFSKWIERNWPSLFLIFAAFYLLYFYYNNWQKYGKDPEKPIVIPYFKAPKNLSPGSLGYIDKGKFEVNQVTANLVDLAIKGFIDIDEVQPTLKKMTYSKIFNIKKQEKKKEDLQGDQLTLIKGLFTKNEEVTIDGTYSTRIKNTVVDFEKVLTKTNKLFIENTSNQHLVKKAFKMILIIFMSALIINAIITMNPIAVVIAIFMIIFDGAFIAFLLFLWKEKSKGLFIGTLIFAAPFIVPIFFIAFSLGSIDVSSFDADCYKFLIFGMGSLLLFRYLINRPGEEKVKMEAEIEGFKMYLSTAEENLLKFHNPPEMTTDLYEKFLPYAIVFGVEGIWGKRFRDQMKDTLDAQPDLSLQNKFSHSFSSAFSKTFQASAVSPVRSYSSSSGSSSSSSSRSSSSSSYSGGSSSSGSSGGGSSGGGGGGGGGGGW